MGLRFRRSIRVAPGVRVNLNKKSVGLTVGGKGFHHTVNSKGRRTTTVGLPGTGLSYQHTSTPSQRKRHGSPAISPLIWVLIVAVIVILVAAAVVR